jgi:hypothetical protein
MRIKTQKSSAALSAIVVCLIFGGLMTFGTPQCNISPDGSGTHVKSRANQEYAAHVATMLVAAHSDADVTVTIQDGDEVAAADKSFSEQDSGNQSQARQQKRPKARSEEKRAQDPSAKPAEELTLLLEKTAKRSTRAYVTISQAPQSPTSGASPSVAPGLSPRNDTCADAAKKFIRDNEPLAKSVDYVRTDHLTDGKASHFFRQVFIGQKKFPVMGSALRVVTDPTCRILYFASANTTHQSEFTDERGAPGPLAAALQVLYPGYRFSEEVGEEVLLHADGKLSVVNQFSASTDTKSYRFSCRNSNVMECTQDLISVTVEATGDVLGLATPGVLPDTATNPPQSIALSDAQVILGSQAVLTTDSIGAFSHPNVTSGAMAVIAALEGPWVRVLNDAGPTIPVGVNHDFDQGSLTLIHNASSSALTTAQVNIFFHTTNSHNFMRQYLGPGTLPGIDIQIEAHANLAQSCNAFYNPSLQTINFFQPGGSCVNTGYSTVIAHEYGHFVVNRLGLAQQAFGEGYGDALAILQYPTQIVGENFGGVGSHIRNLGTANIQYPCYGEIHQCGQIVGGLWLDIKNEMQATLGDVVGLEETRLLFGKWSLLTMGGDSQYHAVHPQTDDEILIADDDDGDISNGTPHRNALCAALANHSIVCAPLVGLTGTFTGPLPELVPVSQSHSVSFEIQNVNAEVNPNQVWLVYKVNSGNLNLLAMTSSGAGIFQGTIPAQNCGDIVRYAVGAQTTTGIPYNWPPNFNTSAKHYTIGSSFATVVEQDFEGGSDWTLGVASDTATGGIWEWGDPVGTIAQAANDHTELGQHCLMTGQHYGACTLSDSPCISNSDCGSNEGCSFAGLGPGISDVDGGTTTAQSPIYPLNPTAITQVNYWRWYSNNTASPQVLDDHLHIDLSLDDGSTWVNYEDLGPGNPSSNGGWQKAEIWLNEIQNGPSSIQMRVRASDEGFGSVVEAALDDISIRQVICDTPPPPTPTCDDGVKNGDETEVDCGGTCPACLLPFVRGDCNGDGNVDISDPTWAIDVLFGAASMDSLTCADACDIDDNGMLDLGDVIGLLNYVFQGVGPLAASDLSCTTDLSDDALSCDISTPFCLPPAP